MRGVSRETFPGVLGPGKGFGQGQVREPLQEPADGSSRHLPAAESVWKPPPPHLLLQGVCLPAHSP